VPKAPDFSTDTVATLGARAALICNNPDSGTLTVGPSDAVNDLAIKLGEAAHIRAARAGQARFDLDMNDDQRAEIANGIWLCASCHTMVDKNKGIDFSSDLLLLWKKDHENTISSLLRTHRSPLPMLRKFTDEGDVAQEAVDIMETHGALFVERNMEVDNYVMESIKSLRADIEKLPRRVKFNLRVKYLLKDLANEFRIFMNNTSKFPVNLLTELDTLRSRVGVTVLRLRDEYGCNVRGDLNRIIPGT